jgi:hypothetical protein
MRSPAPLVAAIVPVAVTALALGTWASVAADQVVWLAVPVALGICGLAQLIGVCVASRLGNEDADIDPIVSLLVGLFCVQIGLFVGTVLLRRNLLLSALLCCALGWLLAKLAARKRALERLRLPPLGSASLLLGVVFTSIWSQQSLSGLVLSADQVISVPWRDAFYHSVFIAHFAHGSAATLGTDPLLGNAALPPYHYAGHMIPSLLVRWAGVSSYAASVGVFAPLGGLSTALAAYSFGRLLVSPLAGLLAVLCCLAVPDPSFYALQSRWVSYFFFQQIAANGALGCALLALAWAYCLKGVAERDRRCVGFALLAGGCVALFKSQIFLGYSFSLLLFAALFLPRLPLRTRAALGVGATALFALSAGVILPAIPRAPTLALGGGGLSENLQLALSRTWQSSRPWVEELAGHPERLYLVGGGLLLGAMLGVVGLLFVALMSSRGVRQRLGRCLVAFGGIVLANFVVVAFLLRPNQGYGDPFELVHKTFVWPYLALSLWCGCGLAAWVAARQVAAREAIGFVVLPLGCIGLGFWSDACAHQLMDGFVYPGSEADARLPIPRGMYETARFLRSHAEEGATVQLAVNDDKLAYSALVERHAVAVILAHTARDESTRQQVQTLQELIVAPTEDDALRLARALHLDYMVLLPGQLPAWSHSMQPIYESAGYKVFAL